MLSFVFYRTCIELPQCRERHAGTIPCKPSSTQDPPFDENLRVKTLYW